MENTPKMEKRNSYKDYVLAPILRRFWRKDKNGEATGIYADFTHTTSHTPLKTSKDCFIFSWAISEYIMVPLKKMLDDATAANDTGTVKKIMGTINWLRKKAFKHSAEVRNEMKAMSEHPEFLKAAGDAQVLEIIDETSAIMEDMAKHPSIITEGKRLGLGAADVKEIMLKIAALHDIGRLAEIDLQSGTKFNGPDMLAHEVDGDRSAVKGVDHAITSYEVAKANGVTDPLILLPIKYHSVRDLEAEIALDPEFQALDKTTQDQVLLFGHSIRDADKIANLISYTKTGVKLCGEMNNPAFHGDCDISEEVLNDFMAGKTVNAKETKTYLDAMLKFASWTYDLHFDFNKERAAKTIINPLFERMREENRDELSNMIKEVRQGWRTYEKLAHLQQSSGLTPELEEKLNTLKESYVPKEERSEYLNGLRRKTLKTLNVINKAHAHITNHMSNQKVQAQGNDATVKQDTSVRPVLPRTANTSALFQIKRREGKIK